MSWIIQFNAQLSETGNQKNETLLMGTTASSSQQCFFFRLLNSFLFTFVFTQWTPSPFRLYFRSLLLSSGRTKSLPALPTLLLYAYSFYFVLLHLQRNLGGLHQLLTFPYKKAAFRLPLLMWIGPSFTHSSCSNSRQENLVKLQSHLMLILFACICSLVCRWRFINVSNASEEDFYENHLNVWYSTDDDNSR